MEIEIAKTARIYSFLVPLGHHVLQVPKGKYHIPACSFYSFYPKHSSTVLWINFPSLCTRTKPRQNEVEALCWPQQTLHQALVHSVDGFTLQTDSIYQNHIEIHNVTHKHKIFLNIHTYIEYLLYIDISTESLLRKGGNLFTLKAPVYYYSLGQLCSGKYSREPTTAVLQ